MEEKMKRRPSLACGLWSVSWLCCVRESNRLDEQLRAIEMLIIYGRRTCPNAPMIDGYCVSKCDSIRWEMFFYPRESGGRDGAKQEHGTVVLTEKIRSEEHTSELQSRFDLVC